MKRLWIRAHAISDVITLARMRYGETDGQGFADDITRLRDVSTIEQNDMLVVEISDDLAHDVSANGYLITCGKVLAKGEEPPYVGSDVRGTEDTE